MPPERSEEDRSLATKRSLIGRLVPKSPSAALKPVSVPEPSKESSGTVLSILGYLTRLAIIMGLSVALLLGAGYTIHEQYISPGPLPTDKVVMIKGGLSDVVEQLVQDGVVERPILLMGAIYLNGVSSRIKAGEYIFKQKASLEDVIGTLTDGKPILQSIMIKEGLTSQQIVDHLKDSELLSGEITSVPPEGTLLPETYKFSRGMNRQQLLDRMMQDHARVVKELWARRVAGLPIQSPAEMVVLASIVEKETGKADERSRVARVFLNRLDKKMRLQSDPTIIYGLVGGKGSLGRAITRSDIESQTPYNTYVIPALPPAPIGNPGRAALEAVINPSQTKELYFVADGTGGHVFAETYEQHQRNVVRWRQIENDRKDAPPPVAQTPALPSIMPGTPPNQAAVPPASAPSPANSKAPVIVAPAIPSPTTSAVTITPANPPVAPAATAAQAEPSASFVPPLQVPLPPLPPAGLRDGSAGSAAPASDQNFDLTTPKTIPKMN